MTDYKLMPVEPTAEMERAAESYWNERRFKVLSDDPRTWAGVYQAMLAAAPAVQGETRNGTYHPLKNIDTWRKGCPCAVTEPGECIACTNGLIDAIEHWLLAGGTVTAGTGHSSVVEALESLIKGYVRLLEAGRDRIMSLGGDCDPVPVMEQNDPWLREARKARATYRSQGGEV